MISFFFFSSRRRHTRSDRDWSSDVCSSDLKELGATVADGAAAAARGAEVLITMLGDDDAVEAMVLGDGGALAALPRGAIHISMSTISPALSRRLSERHRASGQTYVAAPVFGRPEAAERSEERRVGKECRSR